MAVAAHEGVVCLYALKSMDLMRKELREGLGLNPIREVSILIKCIAVRKADVDRLKGKTPASRWCHTEDGISPSTRQ